MSCINFWSTLVFSFAISSIRLFHFPRSLSLLAFSSYKRFYSVSLKTQMISAPFPYPRPGFGPSGDRDQPVTALLVAPSVLAFEQDRGDPAIGILYQSTIENTGDTIHLLTGFPMFLHRSGDFREGLQSIDLSGLLFNLATEFISL